jgi:hypothetical protein
MDAACGRWGGPMEAAGRGGASVPPWGARGAPQNWQNCISPGFTPRQRVHTVLPLPGGGAAATDARWFDCALG